jgi:hypothetical protein
MSGDALSRRQESDFCREAATHYSPGLLALGQVVGKGALKVAPDFRRGGGITREEPKDAPRVPLSGHLLPTTDPGLKPWAVLYSRFAAESDCPYGTTLRRSGISGSSQHLEYRWRVLRSAKDR